MEIQEYELKVGVVAWEELQIGDLLEYLHLELNEYLTTEVKKIAMGAKSNERFTAVFERVSESHLEEQEYVGFIFIYNNANSNSLDHVRRELSELGIKGSDETFLVIAELQGKSLNIAEQEGSLLAKKCQGRFLKLSYQNSEEIVTVTKSYVHTMIQNYYFPNEIIDEEEDLEEEPRHYELNYVSKNVELTHQEERKIEQILQDTPSDEPYLLQMSRRRVNEVSILEDAEKEIDANIHNLEKVLKNMDVHIKSRVDNDWFKSLKSSIYSKALKQSDKYSRVKLTQHFLDQNDEEVKTKTPMETVLLKKRRNLLLRLKFNIGDEQQVEVEVFEDSNYNDLAKQVLRKVGVALTQKSISTIESKIQSTVSGFISQLKHAIKGIHKQKINNRKFLQY